MEKVMDTVTRVEIFVHVG